MPATQLRISAAVCCEPHWCCSGTRSLSAILRKCLATLLQGRFPAIVLQVDEIPLSRPKRNIARDFADSVLLAEIVHHYFPKLVELHNYSSANGIQQKLYNWNTLNQKVFRRLGFMISKQDCEAIATCAPGALLPPPPVADPGRPGSVVCSFPYNVHACNYRAVCRCIASSCTHTSPSACFIITCVSTQSRLAYACQSKA